MAYTCLKEGCCRTLAITFLKSWPILKFCAAEKRRKFATTPVLQYQPHLGMLLHYLRKLSLFFCRYLADMEEDGQYFDKNVCI